MSHQGAYAGRCEPQEATQAGRTNGIDSSATTGRYNGCTCACGTLGCRRQCLCVLCRSAVEMRPIHGHRTMSYTSWFSIRATSPRSSKGSGSGGAYNRSVCTTISSGGASSGGASSGGASPGGASPKGANMDRNARSLQRHVPQGGRHHQKSCGAAR
jgi:hypothetical protein